MTPIVRAVQKAAPSVVNIHGRKVVRNDSVSVSAEDFRQVNGMGTGIVFDPRGYILTNYHVVEGVGRIQVTLADGRTVIADLISHDRKSDLAIIKVSVDEEMQVIDIGTSCDLMPAEPVIAVGNAYGYPHTVTRGIISSLHRSVQVSDDQGYHDLIQTDASINPGNSGGPLLNIDGEMIGINVAVRVGAQGIGFAIPVDEAMEIAARMLRTKTAHRVKHGIVGRTITTPDERKFVVQSVSAGSLAEQAGVEFGDVLVSANGTVIHRALDFECAILNLHAGDKLALRVERDSTEKTVELALGSPSSVPRASSVASRAWESLGIKCVPVESAEIRQVSTRYRGGLKITDVRPGSPASGQGIMPGDILVGMHKWETISFDNLAYILNSDEFKRAQPMKFFIVRGGETLYGHLATN